MKLNFECEDYAITNGDLLRYFNATSKRSVPTQGPLSAMSKTAGYCADYLQQRIDRGIAREKREARSVSAFATAWNALGTVHQYPESDEKEDVRKVLTFMISGALLLFVDGLEHELGRKLATDEGMCVSALLQDVAYKLYIEKHNDEEGNVEENEE